MLAKSRPAGREIELSGHAAEDVIGTGQEVVREAAGDVAGLLEPRQSVGRKVDVEAGEVVGELLRVAGAEDRDDAPLGAQPGQGGDRGGEPEAVSDIGDCPGDRQLPRVDVGQPALAVAPSAARRRAIASPIPALEPVTTARRPLS